MKDERQILRALFNKLVRSKCSAFPKYGEKLDAPTAKGVYVIYNQRRRVLHVGRTPRAAGGIAQRLRNHMGGSSSFTKNYLGGKGSRLRGKCQFRCLVVEDPRLCALLEAYTIGELCPAHIGLNQSIV